MSSPLPNPLDNSTFATAATQNSNHSDGDVREFLGSIANETAKVLGTAAMEEAKNWLPGAGGNGKVGREKEWTGLGLEWLRSWLGGREWRVPCLDVYIRL